MMYLLILMYLFKFQLRQVCVTQIADENFKSFQILMTSFSECYDMLAFRLSQG